MSNQIAKCTIKSCISYRSKMAALIFPRFPIFVQKRELCVSAFFRTRLQQILQQTYNYVYQECNYQTCSLFTTWFVALPQVVSNDPQSSKYVSIASERGDKLPHFSCQPWVKIAHNILPVHKLANHHTLLWQEIQIKLPEEEEAS